MDSKDEPKAPACVAVTRVRFKFAGSPSKPGELLGCELEGRSVDEPGEWERCASGAWDLVVPVARDIKEAPTNVELTREVLYGYVDDLIETVLARRPFYEDGDEQELSISLSVYYGEGGEDLFSMRVETKQVVCR